MHPRDRKPAPKPGDPDFVPRHPVLDLEPIEARIAERRNVALRASTEAVREAVDADTEMMADLLREVKNLRLANELLKEVIDERRHAALERSER